MSANLANAAVLPRSADALVDLDAAIPAHRRLDARPVTGASTTAAAAHDPGLLFGDLPTSRATRTAASGSAAFARAALTQTLHYAQARNWSALQLSEQAPPDYRTAAKQVVSLQNLLEAQDEAGRVGDIFVRFVVPHVPDVATARADVCLALASQASHLFAALTSSPGREAFVAANGAEALPTFRSLAADAYQQAWQENRHLFRGLVGFATAVQRSASLNADVAVHERAGLDPAVQRQLVAHQEALRWPHAVHIRGQVTDLPPTTGLEGDPVTVNWFNLFAQRVAGVQTLLSVELAAFQHAQQTP